VWGRFSDHYGRRPALMVGMTASAIAYIIFAYSNSILMLFVSRLVQGAGGGTVSVIQAYVADALEPKDRAKGLGWLSAATNAGVAIGPVLGSLAMGAGHAFPGLLAAGLCVVNMAFAWRFLEESHDLAGAQAHVRKKGRSREAVLRVATHPGDPASRLIWMYAIGMGAFQGTNAVLALFLSARYGVTAKTIGFFYMFVGVVSVLTRAGILGAAVDRYGEARLSRLGQLLLAAGLLALPLSPLLPGASLVAAMLRGGEGAHPAGILSFVPLALAVGLVPLGTAFTFPCVTALLSRVIPGHERGLYMGVQQTFGGIARVVFPIGAGFLFDRRVELPYFIASAMVLGTIFLGVGMERFEGKTEG
ncbi:MAG TPA: MFS transporter, partial [Gemmatimonadaceae bacterium]|nr:MFS transporter [Gemmatimonadaceae bacterium]